MEKLVVVIMGQNCEKFIGMCLESVKDADAIVYCDGGSTDKTIPIVDNFLLSYAKDNKTAIIENKYNQEDKGMNGKQRNFYLDYIKKNYPDWWCLVLDADEIVYDLNEVKEFIQTMKPGVYSPRMRHLIGNLGYEDNIKPEHFVLHRLFKISNADRYPELEHPVLIPKQGGGYGGTDIMIWHLAYIPGMFDIKKRYENHLKKSQMHSKEFLRDWYYKHLFGTYPIKKVNSIDLPKELLNFFGIDKDEVYFATHKRLEVKHFLLMKQFCDKFKPKKILDLGCGMGIYGFVSKIMKIPYLGIELSNYAVKTNPYNVNIKQGDITKKLDEYGDLVLVLDILEHLEYEDLDKTLKLISKYGNHYIFSLPFLGDKNLEKDPTHIIKETKDWWIKALSKYFKVWEMEGWLFGNQILVGDAK